MKLSKAIIVTGCPFKLFDHPLWHEFFEALRPSFNLPDRKKIGGDILDKIYTETKEEVQKKLESSNTEIFHLQLDGWSNLRNESLINFVISTPEPLFVKFLETGAERHTAEYLQAQIEVVLEQFGVQRFGTIIADNASNIQKALDNIQKKYPHLIVQRCMAHTLNLLCHDILKVECVAKLIASVNEIIKHIRNSQVLTALLKKRLPLYVKTRWGTMEKSLTGLIKNKFSLQSLAINPLATMMNKTVKKDLLCSEFWRKVECLRDIFLPITQLITRIEGDNLYIHTVYDELKSIDKSTELLKSFLTSKDTEDSGDSDAEVDPVLEFNGIKKKITERKEAILQPIHYAAVLLNPKDRGFSLTDAEQMEAIKFISDLSIQRDIVEKSGTYFIYLYC